MKGKMGKKGFSQQLAKWRQKQSELDPEDEEQPKTLAQLEEEKKRKAQEWFQEQACLLARALAEHACVRRLLHLLFSVWAALGCCFGGSGVLAEASRRHAFGACGSHTTSHCVSLACTKAADSQAMILVWQLEAGANGSVNPNLIPVKRKKV